MVFRGDGPCRCFELSHRIDYLEESFPASEVYLFSVDVNGRGSLESELVSECHILLDFRYVVSFLHTCLKFPGIESYLFCDIFTIVRTNGISFFLVFESVHLLGEFLVFSLRFRTKGCERVFRSVLVYTKRVHAVF